MISPNNIYIICLSVLQFAFYAFARYGLNRIALSTSLIASIPVRVAEAGKYKSAIAYYGDVLTTTARMLSKCHEPDSELLVPEEVLSPLEMPTYLRTDVKGTFQRKGKQQDTALHSVYMTTDKLSKEKRRIRLFRRKAGKSAREVN